MMHDLMKTAVNAALVAGREIMSIYESGDFDVTMKGDDSPLTRADVAAHHAIIAQLDSTSIPLLSEEGKSIAYAERAAWKRLWIVDPIDGTKEFIKRNGEFTVNIALVDSGEPVMGVVLVPARGEMYFGAQGIGAFRSDGCGPDASPEEWMQAGVPLPLPQPDRPFTAVASRSHMSSETEEYIESLRDHHGTVELISKGSSLKLCMVAAGFADCYPRFAPTMEWDTAAGQAVCMAAGCHVMNWETKQALTYNRPELLNPWFLVRGPRALTA